MKNCPLEVINCPHHGKNMFEEGCDERLRRCDMDAHAQECEYRKVSYKLIFPKLEFIPGGSFTNLKYL